MIGDHPLRWHAILQHHSHMAGGENPVADHMAAYVQRSEKMRPVCHALTVTQGAPIASPRHSKGPGACAAGPFAEVKKIRRRGRP